MRRVSHASRLPGKLACGPFPCDCRSEVVAKHPVVPLFDVARGLEPLRDRISAAIADVMRSGQLTLGPWVARFEQQFAALCGTDHCVGVSDGTSALRLALIGLGVGGGASVVTVPNTFVATVEAIDGAGARPLLVDVDERTRCMDPRLLAGAMERDTAAVVPVHLYGRMAPLPEIAAAAGGALVVEDAAQAHGAALGGRRAGAWGDAAAFSFYPTKNLAALGDGGAVVTGRADVAEAIRSLRHHGAEDGDSNRHVRRGATARLDAVQAAVLALRLERLEAENEQRRRVAGRYGELLADLPVALPPAADTSDVHHLFVVEVPERDRVLQVMREAGIGAAVHYPIPIHLQPAWRHLGYARGDFPVAERLADTCLSLPCFPSLTEEEQLRVAGALREALR
jgi:dTDP-4-amino-4,6-dideoxygalactose transaminase